MNVKFRQELERKIARQLVKDAITYGYTVDVNDGEETTLTGSTDLSAILKAMFTTDEDYLIFRRGDDSGWVYFVYGNDGWDVINDYTIGLEPLMEAGTNKLIDELEAKYA